MEKVTVESHEPSLIELNDDVLVQLLKFLTATEVCRMMVVNTLFKKISSSNEVWAPRVTKLRAGKLLDTHPPVKAGTPARVVWKLTMIEAKVSYHFHKPIQHITQT